MAESKKISTKTLEQSGPSEESILRELRQREVRRQYQTSDKAKANRKAYQQKRYAQTKADRAAVDNLKKSDPAKYAELVAKALADVAAKKK